MGLCATDCYVRVGVGLDTMSASPMRGAIYGGLGEVLDVTVTVDCLGGGPGNGRRGRMSQSQSGLGQSQSG